MSYTTSGAKHFQKMKKRGEKIRRVAEKYLEGNSFGASSRKIKKETDLDFSPVQIGTSLSESDRVENIARSDHAIWRLKDES